MEFNFVSILGHLEYIFLITAFMFRNVTYLRLIALASSISAVLYYSLCADKPLLINIGWEICFSTINIYQLIIITCERYLIRFTDKELKIYNDSFSRFSPQQFKKLLKVGRFSSFEKGEFLIKINKPVETLSIIYDGKVEIIREDKVVAYCETGNIIGELSFLSGTLATADVVAIKKTFCLFWDQKTLKKLLDKDEAIFANFQLTFNEELVRKIVKSNY